MVIGVPTETIDSAENIDFESERGENGERSRETSVGEADGSKESFKEILQRDRRGDGPHQRLRRPAVPASGPAQTRHSRRSEGRRPSADRRPRRGDEEGPFPITPTQSLARARNLQVLDHFSFIKISPLFNSEIRVYYLENVPMSGVSGFQMLG